MENRSKTMFRNIEKYKVDGDTVVAGKHMGA